MSECSCGTKLTTPILLKHLWNETVQQQNSFELLQLSVRCPAKAAQHGREGQRWKVNYSWNWWNEICQKFEELKAGQTRPTFWMYNANWWGYTLPSRASIDHEHILNVVEKLLLFQEPAKHSHNQWGLWEVRWVECLRLWYVNGSTSCSVGMRWIHVQSHSFLIQARSKKGLPVLRFIKAAVPSFRMWRTCPPLTMFDFASLAKRWDSIDLSMVMCGVVGGESFLTAVDLCWWEDGLILQHLWKPTFF